MDCGGHSGKTVDCDAADTPDEAAKQAERLEIREWQERIFKTASEACDLYSAHRS